MGVCPGPEYLEGAFQYFLQFYFQQNWKLRSREITKCGANTNLIFSFCICLIFVFFFVFEFVSLFVISAELEPAEQGYDIMTKCGAYQFDFLRFPALVGSYQHHQGIKQTFVCPRKQ